MIFALFFVIKPVVGASHASHRVSAVQQLPFSKIDILIQSNDSLIYTY